MGKNLIWSWTAWCLIFLFGGGGCADMAVKTPVGDVVWTRFQEEKSRKREEAVARYNYCPTGGCVVRLEEVQLSPLRATPGATLTLTTTYTILTPEDVPIPLSISREILFRGKSLSQRKAIDTNNKNGTFTQQIDITLPREATPGIYTLITRVSTGYGTDEKKLEFTVD